MRPAPIQNNTMGQQRLCPDHPTLAWMQGPWLIQWCGLKCCHVNSLLARGMNDCVSKSHTARGLLHSAAHYKHLWSLSHNHTYHTGNLSMSTQTSASSQVSLAEPKVKPTVRSLALSLWYSLILPKRSARNVNSQASAQTTSAESVSEQGTQASSWV